MGKGRLETEAEYPSSGTAVDPVITDNAVGMAPQWFHVLQW